MKISSKVVYYLRQRLRPSIPRVLAQNATSSNQYSSQAHGQDAESNKTHNGNHKAVYAATLAATALGMYYYFQSKEKVHALEKRSIRCGELRKDLKTYTLQEVGKHDNKESRIWVTFKRGVYDITDFVEKHPGGPSKIIMAAGSSVEPFWSIFANHNSPEIYELLESMRIGNISEEDTKAATDGEYDPYANEPGRHKALKINGHKPFCAEPPPSLLVASFITPTELFYVRNHLPVPEIDSKDYRLELAIEDTTKKTLDFETIKQKYPKYSITSAVMCGGNRRSEMAAEKPLRGLSWSVGAVGNATWTGARLCDVLKELGINEENYDHVQFEGYDLDPSGTPYGASVPISKALDPRADIILAYEMNGQPISRDHGFPIRVIVPGVVGARNVKWLGKINIAKEESTSQFQRGDYKGFSPSIDWDNVDFSKSPAIQEMPVISAICVPESSETVKVVNGKIEVKGYAWSGGGRKIIRVDVTNDEGKTWHTADLYAEDVNAKVGRYWSWTLWSAEVPVAKGSKETEIWAKAVDASYNVQPESFRNIWNLRGLLCNAYHKVKVKLDQ